MPVSVKSGSKRCRYCDRVLMLGVNWNENSKKEHKNQCVPVCSSAKKVKINPLSDKTISEKLTELEIGIKKVYQQTSVVKRLQAMQELFKKVGVS